MSVLIKGMKMPKSCIQCFAQMGGLCFVAPPEIDEKVAPTVEKAAEQGRPEWCPLIEIPDHGDLIDRDAYLDKLRTVEDDGVWMYAATVSVSVMPAVIPAERSEE